MPTLLLRFPGRRYHATPWGHHVNEGLVEWPPSPWRVLRALLSVGYSACSWPASFDEPWRSLPPEPARSMLLALAGTAPHYKLPPATGAHSRHYMPTAVLENGREDTTLVFDTWAQVESGELAITWDVLLSDDQIEALGQLAERLGYLGRSESWVHAYLISAHQAEVVVHNCHAGGQAPAGPGWEQVALLAPQPPEAYASWREAGVRQALSSIPELLGTGKEVARREAERVAAAAMYPADTLACLQVDTRWLRQYGWSQPPGSHRLLYWRRRDALETPAGSLIPGFCDEAMSRPARSDQRKPLQCVLLSLASQTLNDHALPVIARGLPQAEMIHRQVLGIFGKLGLGRHSAVLSGCDAEGKPLRGAHSHAHLLPMDLDSDGHIDHVLVWATDGLPDPEQEALRRLRATYAKGRAGAIRVALVGSGELPDLLRLALPQGSAIARALGAGTQWVSATPFVAPRHLKARGRNTLEGQVVAELASRGLPSPVLVERLDPQHNERARQLRHHVRTRKFGPAPPVDAGHSLRLHFAEAVVGPLCLGYGSHFGLGRFELETGTA